MASAAQVLANQQNAQLSTGPRSEAGKAASSRNAVRHGLTGAFRVLAHEDQQEFDQLSTRLVDEYEPNRPSYAQNEPKRVSDPGASREELRVFLLPRVQRTEESQADTKRSRLHRALGIFSESARDQAGN